MMTLYPDYFPFSCNFLFFLELIIPLLFLITCLVFYATTVVVFFQRLLFSLETLGNIYYKIWCITPLAYSTRKSEFLLDRTKVLKNLKAITFHKAKLYWAHNYILTFPPQVSGSLETNQTNVVLL